MRPLTMATFAVVVLACSVPAGLAAHATAASAPEQAPEALLQSGKLQGLALLVDSEGFIRNLVPYVGDLRGNRMLASAGELTSFTVQKESVSGQGALTPEDTMQQGWSFAASWNATLLAAR